MIQTVLLAVLALYLFSCSTGSQAQTQLPTATSDVASATVDLSERHPDAGIWVSYRGDNSVEDLKAPYIKGVMAYARWRDLYQDAQTFDWQSLDRDLEMIINEANKKSFITVAAGYCPELDWPEPVKQRIAARKTKHQKGCQPLQFWDPEYLNLQKVYIRALAEHLAEFDATDRNPGQTDVLFVRAQVMAETMENLPRDYQNWEWQDFNPAPNGRIYQVNLTEEISYNYQHEIGLAYKQELERAYRARGLLVSPVAVIKGGDFWDAKPNRDVFIQEGLWLDQHNGSPNPMGWYYDFVEKARTGQTRATMESGQHWPAAYLGQFTYWEVLSALHSGVEFISLYGNNRELPNLQPKGPVNFPENREIVTFGTHYAGTARNPAKSPGAWIALRGNYPQDRFSQLHHVRIWTNLEHLITQYRPQDSVLLVGVNAEESAFRDIMPQVRREEKGPWPDEIATCRQEYPAYECEFLYQAPDRFLGQANGRYAYTYSQSDLGNVLYCGTDMFCERRDAATRSEPMLWARRTNGAAGSPYMRFNLNDPFASSLGSSVRVRVVYLDQGKDRWSLEYDSQSDPNKSAVVVQKTNSNLWKEVFVNLNDVKFENRQQGGTDISLYNMGDGDDIFHLIEVVRPGTEMGSVEDDNGTIPSVPPAPARPSLPPVVNVFQEQNGEVVMEAENFSALGAGKAEAAAQRWDRSTDFASASGEAAMRALPDQGASTDDRLNGPMLAYRINFKHAGQYQVAVRGLGPDQQANSVHVGLDGERATNSDGLSWSVGEGKFTWRQSYQKEDGSENYPLVVNVAEAGLHTLNIWMREDGVVVDKIWLTRTAAPENSPTPEDPADNPIKSPVDDGSPDLGPVESPTEMAPLTKVQLPLVMQN